MCFPFRFGGNVSSGCSAMRLLDRDDAVVLETKMIITIPCVFFTQVGAFVTTSIVHMEKDGDSQHCNIRIAAIIVIRQLESGHLYLQDWPLP
jgi:hypothetical protein